MTHNILANIAGRFWSVISSFLFIPLYIRILGLHSYAIISVTLVMAGISASMDLGLTSALAREFASASNDNDAKVKTLESLESCYLGLLGLVLVSFLVLTHPLAAHWLTLGESNENNVDHLLRVASIGLAFQLLSKFYLGGLLGLECQVAANILQIAFGVARNALVVPIILWRPSLEAFFLWQTTTSIVYCAALRHVLTRRFGRTHRPRVRIVPDVAVLKRVWRFAGGVTLIALVASVGGQMDRIAISTILSVETLGLYTLAYSLAQAVGFLTNPISTALLPRLTGLYTGGRTSEASTLFVKVFALTAAVVFAIATTLSFNAERAVWIWTGSVFLAHEAGVLVPPLTIAASLLSVCALPFNLALANGYTRLNNYLGIGSLVVTLPGYWLATRAFGALGAAYTFLFVQAVVTVVYLGIISRRYLTVTWPVVMRDHLGRPLCAAFIAGSALSAWHPSAASRYVALLHLGACCATTIVVTVILGTPPSARAGLATVWNARRPARQAES